MNTTVQQNISFNLVIVAVVKEDFTSCGCKFLKGEECIVDHNMTNTSPQNDAEEIHLLKRCVTGFEIFRIAMDKFELKVEAIKSPIESNEKEKLFVNLFL